MFCGIDIGGTHTVIGCVRADGFVEEQRELKTTDYKEIELYVEAIAWHIQDMISKHDKNLQGIGICCPKGNTYTGCMENASNTPFKGNIPLAKMFGQYFSCPIDLSNDANAAAVGEMIFGKAKNISDFIMITIGTGLGSGIIANGRLILGLGSMAGEIGHTIVFKDGRSCACGRKGCLERYVSASGIMQTYQDICRENNKTARTENLKELTKLGEEGDPLVLKTFDKTADTLALALSNATATTAPSHFFLFGGVMRTGELLMKPLRQYFEEYLLDCYRGKIRIELSGLMEKNAAVVGAAALAAAKASQ